MSRHPSNTENPVRQRMETYAQACAERGLYPFEGQWLSTGEIDRQQRARARREQIQVAELGLLFILAHVVTIASLRLVALFSY